LDVVKYIQTKTKERSKLVERNSAFLELKLSAPNLTDKKME
jgi:hypothetical protein